MWSEADLCQAGTVEPRLVHRSRFIAATGTLPFSNLKSGRLLLYSSDHPLAEPEPEPGDLRTTLPCRSWKESLEVYALDDGDISKAVSEPQPQAHGLHSPEADPSLPLGLQMISTVRSDIPSILPRGEE